MTSAQDKLLLDRAAAMATQGHPAMQQAPQRAMPIMPEHLINFVALAVITPEQCFDLIFKGKTPEEYVGPSAEHVRAKVEKDWAEKLSKKVEELDKE